MPLPSPQRMLALFVFSSMPGKLCCLIAAFLLQEQPTLPGGDGGACALLVPPDSDQDIMTITSVLFSKPSSQFVTSSIMHRNVGIGCSNAGPVDELGQPGLQHGGRCRPGLPGIKCGGQSLQAVPPCNYATSVLEPCFALGMPPQSLPAGLQASCISGSAGL